MFGCWQANYTHYRQCVLLPVCVYLCPAIIHVTISSADSLIMMFIHRLCRAKVSCALAVAQEEKSEVLVSGVI